MYHKQYRDILLWRTSSGSVIAAGGMDHTLMHGFVRVTSSWSSACRIESLTGGP